MVEEAEKTCESIDSIIEKFSEVHSKVEDEKDETVTKAATNRSINPNAFFKNLRDKGAQQRESAKDTTAAPSGDSKKNIDDFKKKLFLKNIDTN